MKQGKALIIGFILVFLIALGVGIYFYLNSSGRINPQVSTELPLVEERKLVTNPTPVLSIEEELDALQIASDDAELQDLQKDLGGL